MATVGLGVSWDQNSREELGGVRCYPGESHQSPYIIWHSDTGTDWIDHYDISVAWKYVPKGAAGFGDSGSYGTYGERVWCGLTAAQCNPTKSSSDYYTWWSYPLGSVGGADGTLQVATWVAPAGWNFDQRIYDGIVFRVAVRAYYVDGKVDQYGQTYSRVEVESVLAYIPNITITSCSMDGTYFNIEYDSGTWTRNDDRYALEKVIQGNENKVVYKGPGKVYEYVTRNGLIKVPLNRFIEIPEEGHTEVTLRFNEGFRDIEQDMNYSYWSGDLVNTDACNTPVFVVEEATDEHILLTFEDAGDRGRPFNYVDVYVQGSYYAGSDFRWRTTDSKPLEIPWPPLGVELVLEAIAYTNEGGRSSVVEEVVGPIGKGSVSEVDYVTISPLDDMYRTSVVFRYNVSEDWSYEPVMTTVKFSGRDRESVAYGIGGSVTGTVKCDILDDERYGDMFQSREDFENLITAGVCLLRGPDGERRRVAVESVSESWDRVRFVKQVSVTVREVM